LRPEHGVGGDDGEEYAKQNHDDQSFARGDGGKSGDGGGSRA